MMRVCMFWIDTWYIFQVDFREIGMVFCFILYPLTGLYTQW